ncbi:hypothetical protein [Rhizobium sp. BK399]|uniref:hypothetical protein n=1 Tax=Rhizobium sp. BK399 TaxID=2587063 RepID=UPI0017C10DE8|nr:hypothetical protein [Rhizobium sp. BK399]
MDNVLQLALDPITQFAALVLVLVFARALVRGKPTQRFLVHIAFFVILTILLVGNDVAPWTAGRR